MDFEPMPSQGISPKAAILFRLQDLGETLTTLFGGVFLWWAFAPVPWGRRLILGGGALILFAQLGSLLLAGARQRAWRYELWQENLELLRGVFFKRRTLIPLAAIQFVDTTQGPLERLFNLSSLRVSTAAGSNRIPGLVPDTAAELRSKIVAKAGIEHE